MVQQQPCPNNTKSSGSKNCSEGTKAALITYAHTNLCTHTHTHTHTHTPRGGTTHYTSTDTHGHTVNRHPPTTCFCGQAHLHVHTHAHKHTHTHTHTSLRTHYTIQETLAALARNANWNKQLMVSSFLRWELAVIETSVCLCVCVCVCVCVSAYLQRHPVLRARYLGTIEHYYSPAFSQTQNAANCLPWTHISADRISAPDQSNPDLS